MAALLKRRPVDSEGGRGSTRAAAPAAVAILDRGWGKPQQTVEVTQSVFDQMTDDEQKIMLAAMAALKAAEEDRPETLN